MKIQLLYLLFFICMVSNLSDKNIRKAFLIKPEKSSYINKENLFNQILKFIPDTSINGLSLKNSESIMNSIGDLMKYLDKDKDIPYVIVLSKDKKQYLKLSFFSGSNKNEFSYFKIGILNNKLLNTQNKIFSKFNAFITENNIKIGISKEVFFKYRNKHLLKSQNNNIYVYEDDNFKNSAFLKAYNMPSYRAKYIFKKDTLVHFEFGFDYP